MALRLNIDFLKIDTEYNLFLPSRCQFCHALAIKSHSPLFSKSWYQEIEANALHLTPSTKFPLLLLFINKKWFPFPVLHPGLHYLRGDAGRRDPTVRLPREGDHYLRPGVVRRYPVLRSTA